ncbi:hypothetical protein CU098_000500 [Rhizopus stolonifer]|uniref:Arrestin C-terminal-like domain-containing protein n=1 Tax=Rhizopus stolonifer TaxID=4846 RepID=A0A367KJL7_RHIST|nr:hypothetical protein CU098_000500 [Rhizopus stolonifer]
MADLFKSKENEFYIELKEDRYYLPGEDISGDVVLDLKKATKTHNIKLTLEGIVDIGGREITLFSKSTVIAESPDGEKSYYLEAFTHRFPFKITIPTAKECKVPSTLEINKLIKVSYQLTAVYDKAFSFSDMFSPSTSIPINMLENINVESVEFAGEQKFERELILSGETRPVKVLTIVGKRAAVKGDIIPISIEIEHIGVIVRDKAIRVQLLRSVYYGKNNSELFGPKLIREGTANIDISGPTCFTKTFVLKMPIPHHICPSVDKSGQSFKIEYMLRISVNLNEENPLRPESDGDIVIFNVPFTIGTYPKLAFNIDDDEEDEENRPAVEEEADQKDQDSMHSEEYNQIAEKMKDLDLEEHNPPEMVQQSKESEPSHQDSIEHIDPLLSMDKPEIPSNKPSPSPSMAEIITPPLDMIANSHSLSPNSPATSISHSPTSPKIRMIPSEVYSDCQPTSPSNTTHPNSDKLGKRDSVRWIVRNQDDSYTPPQASPTFQDKLVSPVIGFAMPTPSISQSTAHVPTNPPPIPQRPSPPSPLLQGLSPSSSYQQPTSPYQRPSSPYLHSSTPYSQPTSPYPQPTSPYPQPSTPYQQPPPSHPLHYSKVFAPHQFPPYIDDQSNNYNHHPQYDSHMHPRPPPSPHNFHHDGPYRKHPLQPEPHFYHQANSSHSSQIGFPMPQQSNSEGFISMPSYKDYYPN